MSEGHSTKTLLNSNKQTNKNIRCCFISLLAQQPKPANNQDAKGDHESTNGINTYTFR